MLFLGFCFFTFYKNNLEISKKYGIEFSKYFYFKFLFLFFSFFSIFLSIFGIKYFPGDKEQRMGIDIVFVLDVSKSMNVADVRGDGGNYLRLDFAKKSIGYFVLKNKNNRYSLVIFAGDAKSTLPLTNDTDLFLTFLQKADYRDFENQGTSFEKAVKLAETRLLYAENKSKAIVFVSDGGDDDYEFSDEIKKTIGKKSKYFIVGVGSSDGGKIILGEDIFGRKNFQKYDGKEVIAKLGEKNLKKLANLTNGKYLKMDKITDLDKFQNDLEKLEKNIFSENFSNSMKSISRILAFVSFFFFVLFLAFYIFDNKKYEK
ncbi:hypothetical protein BLD25_04110 [Candidatus Gracilibacteria bacterium GN02-872]|nr:hypothetical protein BLD25_04110 [Candidatus Gracilibacteria bacterium GN02-872]